MAEIIKKNFISHKNSFQKKNHAKQKSSHDDASYKKKRNDSELGSAEDFLTLWTKKDGIIMALISFFEYQKVNNDFDYVSSDQIIKFGFAKSEVYKYVDYLVRNNLLLSQNPKFRTTKNLVKPTPTFVNELLPFYNKQLKDLKFREELYDSEFALERIRLEMVCKSLEKIQTLFFSSPG